MISKFHKLEVHPRELVLDGNRITGVGDVSLDLISTGVNEVTMSILCDRIEYKNHDRELEGSPIYDNLVKELGDPFEGGNND